MPPAPMEWLAQNGLGMALPPQSDAPAPPAPAPGPHGHQEETTMPAAGPELLSRLSDWLTVHTGTAGCEPSDAGPAIIKAGPYLPQTAGAPAGLLAATAVAHPGHSAGSLCPDDGASAAWDVDVGPIDIAQFDIDPTMAVLAERQHGIPPAHGHGALASFGATAPMATPPGSAAAATEKFCLEPPPAAAGGAVQSMVAAGVQGVGAGATAGQVGPPPQHAAQMAIGTAKKDGGETPRGGSPAAMPVGGAATPSLTELSAAEATTAITCRVRALKKQSAGSGAGFDDEDIKFPCPYPACDKQFGRPSHLKKHLYIHTGERNYKCEVCSSAFKTQWTLTKHTRIHTGEKPFSCDECDMHFTQRGSWRRHLFSHHRKQVDTSLQCEMHRCPKCAKCYKERANLAKHLKAAHGATAEQAASATPRRNTEKRLKVVEIKTAALLRSLERKPRAPAALTKRRNITPFVRTAGNLLLEGSTGSRYGVRVTLS